VWLEQRLACGTPLPWVEFARRKEEEEEEEEGGGSGVDLVVQDVVQQVVAVLQEDLFVELLALMM